MAAPFWAAAGFQEEKLPERRLRAEWDRRSKLVRLLSELLGGWWAGALPCVWAEVAWAVGVASRAEPRAWAMPRELFELELLAALTGR